MPRIDHGVDRFFTAPLGAARGWGGAGAGVVGASAVGGQRRRERGWGRVLLAGMAGGGLAVSRVGLSLGLYDSPSMTKS